MSARCTPIVAVNVLWCMVARKSTAPSRSVSIATCISEPPTRWYISLALATSPSDWGRGCGSGDGGGGAGRAALALVVLAVCGGVAVVVALEACCEASGSTCSAGSVAAAISVAAFSAVLGGLFAPSASGSLEFPDALVAAPVVVSLYCFSKSWALELNDGFAGFCPAGFPLPPFAGLTLETALVGAALISAWRLASIA